MKKRCREFLIYQLVKRDVQQNRVLGFWPANSLVFSHCHQVVRTLQYRVINMMGRSFPTSVGIFKTIQNGLMWEGFLLAFDTNRRLTCISAFFIKVTEGSHFPQSLVLASEIQKRAAALGNCSL